MSPRTRSTNAQMMNDLLDTLKGLMLSKKVPFILDDMGYVTAPKCMHVMCVYKRHRYICTVLCITGPDNTTTRLDYHIVDNRIDCRQIIPQRPNVPSSAVYHTPEAARDVFIDVVMDIMCENLMRHISARKIQRAWRVAIVDPRFGVCKKRLLREFNDLRVGC